VYGALDRSVRERFVEVHNDRTRAARRCGIDVTGLRWRVKLIWIVSFQRHSRLRCCIEKPLKHALVAIQDHIVCENFHDSVGIQMFESRFIFLGETLRPANDHEPIGRVLGNYWRRKTVGILPPPTDPVFHLLHGMSDE
jgi:hypothetical protein